MANDLKQYVSGKFREILISVFLAVCALLDLFLLGCETASGESAATTAFSGGYGTLSGICLILFCLLAFSLVTAAVGIFLALVKKSVPLSSVGVLLVCHVVLFVLSSAFEGYEALGLFLIIFNLLLLVIGGAYCVLCLFLDPARGKPGKRDGGSRPAILALGVLALILTMALFLVPFCAYSTTELIPLDAVFGETAHRVEGLIVFSVLFALATVDFVLFLRALEDASGQDSLFAAKMQRVITLSAFATGAYFVGGAIYCTFYQKSTSPVSTSILPFLCMAGTAVGYAFITRRVNRNLPESPEYKGKTGTKVEFFLYGMFLSLITVGASLTDILKVTMKEPESGVVLTLNGLKILTKINGGGEGTRFTAFILLVILTLTVTLFLSSLVSLIGKSEIFRTITLAQCLCGVASCMMIGLIGKYYEVVQKINEQTIVAMLEDYIGAVDIRMVYNVKSASFYWFIAAMVVALIVLLRRPYTRLALQKAPAFAGAGPRTPGLLPEEGADMGKPMQIADPCPAFTELDRKVELFARQSAESARSGFESPTLANLVQFVVNYARDSRLHLSYRAEDIAAFIAGMGASRLTILQGMSGTGKTSLPKIFAEALFGNCEIIEVESSWRDKHELLGYYNEFSKTYTPKKFTQALYKAKLNPDQLTLIVLDEMNLSRIEYYFSDFLSLMENEEDKREIKLLNVGLCRVIEGRKVPYRGLIEGHTLKIPSNVWFIGTANRDESTFEISDKVYDRAHTMNFNKRAPKVATYHEPIPQRWISAEQFTELLRQADRAMDFDIESCSVIGEVEELLAPYNISFGNRVAGQIETFVRIYCACFPSSERVLNEAVETILLSKVVSKLEYRSVENKEKLAAELRRLGLDRCSEFVLKLNED